MTRLFEAQPFLIAEIGSNFSDLTTAMTSVRLAKEAGADAVKFQIFNSQALYGRHGVEVWGLPYSYLPPLKRLADHVGIELMVTAFSPLLVAEVDPYVSVHKIASSDLNYPQLLDAVGRCGKPVILSTGAAPASDIDMALDILDSFGCDIILLYCVASYPARTVDLRVMIELERRYDIEVGFSDHTTDIIGYPTLAVDFGATVIEKHVTFFPELATPDRPHSLTGPEFKTMVDHIRGTLEPKIGPTSEEAAMTARHRRRLVATIDIKVGDRLIYGENYGAYRSLVDDDHGMSPFLWNHSGLGPEGKPARVAITKGKGIGLGDF